jgi:hypothetical protein
MTAVPEGPLVSARTKCKVHIGSFTFWLPVRPQEWAGVCEQQSPFNLSGSFMAGCIAFVFEEQQHIWPQSELENPVVAKKLKLNSIVRLKQSIFRKYIFCRFFIRNNPY